MIPANTIPSDPHTLPTIGWRERVTLPDWRLTGVRAKIDTGARTSAIDVAQIVDLPDGRIRFEVVSRAKPRKTRWIEAPVARMSTVRPSHGVPHQRHVCVTRMRIGDVEHEIEVSLVCRANMLCRMLIARRALAGWFLVDPSRTYVLSSPRKTRSGTEGTSDRSQRGPTEGGVAGAGRTERGLTGSRDAGGPEGDR